MFTPGLSASLSLGQIGVCAAANLPAIEASLTAAETAYSSSNQRALNTALTSLQDLVTELPDGQNMSRQLHRLTQGRSRIQQRELDIIIGIIRNAVTAESDEVENGAVDIDEDSASFRITLEQPVAYTPRPDQRYISDRAPQHFADTNRGIFRMDTGMGKSLTYGFAIQRLEQKLPGVFGKARYVIGCHQAEPALDLAKQIKALFPAEEVAFLEGGMEADDLKGYRFVVGTYQQLAQENTVTTLKNWAGRQRVMFVLDEADMVVFKGIKESNINAATSGDDPDWHASWFRPLIEFGLFNEMGHFQSRSKHYMLGGSATLDRPDGIPLSTVWGPGNVFYHTPMAEGIRKSLLVPVIGKVLEMDIPENADPSEFREFTRVERDGTIVVDKSKVASAAASDYGVKTAVRAYLDHIFMDVGVGRQKSRTVRKAIGYAADRTSLEKHMRWQQDLFDLVEVIFRVQSGLTSSRQMQASTIVRGLDNQYNPNSAEQGGLVGFGEELKRFLYGREWKQIEPLYDRAMASLRRGRRDGVKDFFNTLYQTLKVDARRIKGKRLLATAVWQDMEKDEEGRQVRVNGERHLEAAVINYPHKKWPNRFGDRNVTMEAFKSGEIDILWSIGMLERGFNYPMASLIIDNAPTGSRRGAVQRLGRIMRPPDGHNPKDHTRKPDAMYLTVTVNLETHQLDLSRWDLARLFGNEIDPDLRIIRVQEGGDIPEWRTPDTVQLDLKSGEVYHLVRVGSNTSKAILNFLKRNYRDDRDKEHPDKFDVEVAAFDAGIATEHLDHLLKAIQFPKESKLRNWLQAWGASESQIRSIMATYHSDLADMKTVYGGAWRIISQGQKK